MEKIYKILRKYLINIFVLYIVLIIIYIYIIIITINIKYYNYINHYV